MFRLIRGTGLLVLLGAFILPVSGADVKKDPPKRIDEVDKSDKDKTDKTDKTDKKPGKEKEVDPYVTVAQFEGNVKQVGSGTKTFTLELINRQPIRRMCHATRLLVRRGSHAQQHRPAAQRVQCAGHSQHRQQMQVQNKPRSSSSRRWTSN